MLNAAPIIKKLAQGQFQLTYAHLPDFELKMDFSPIIERFKLSGKYCLLHWQAKPKGLRRWGIYDGEKDDYFASDWDKFELKTPQVIPLQLDENIITTVPTAVLLLPNCGCIYKGFLKISQ
jgi:hypothetical protein